MTIYEPVFQEYGIYSQGVGKDSPYGKQTSIWKPNVYGPGGGRFRGIINVGVRGYQYFKKNPRFVARIGAVGAGAGVRYATDSKYRKTLRATKSFRYSKRSYFKRSFSRRKATTCCCHTQSGSRRM